MVNHACAFSQSEPGKYSEWIIAELHPCAKRARGRSPIAKECGNLPIQENLVITWPYDRPSAPQGNQCLLSHFLASLGESNCTSMLWSIDSCQNRISADQYHLTVLRAHMSTHRGRILFWSYPLTNHQFQLIAGSSLFFPMIHMKYAVFMSLWPCTVKILISNWPRTRKLIQPLF